MHAPTCVTKYKYVLMHVGIRWNESRTFLEGIQVTEQWPPGGGTGEQSVGGDVFFIIYSFILFKFLTMCKYYFYYKNIKVKIKEMGNKKLILLWQ